MAYLSYVDYLNFQSTTQANKFQIFPKYSSFNLTYRYLLQQHTINDFSKYGLKILYIQLSCISYSFIKFLCKEVFFPAFFLNFSKPLLF